MKHNGDIFQRFDGEFPCGDDERIAVGFGERQDDADRAGIFGNKRVRVHYFGADAVLFHFDLLKCDTLCDGQAFEEVGYLIDLQLLVLEVLQPKDSYGRQGNLRRGLGVEFVRHRQFQRTRLTEFVSGYDSPGFGRALGCEGQFDLAFSGEVVRPSGGDFVVEEQLIAL